MAALRFIGVLAIGAILLLGARWLNPHVIDDVALYVCTGFAVLALAAAVIGLLRT